MVFTLFIFFCNICISTSLLRSFQPFQHFDVENCLILFWKYRNQIITICKLLLRHENYSEFCFLMAEKNIIILLINASIFSLPDEKINNIQVSFPDITYKLRKLIYNMRYKRINIQIV